LAVKIVRQEKTIALLGVPTSSAALAAGQEGAPAALRNAGLVSRLGEAGYTVTDYGDCETRTFTADEEHPRARNVKQVLATLEELRPKIEVAVKSGALPIVLGGDSSIVLATVAGARRYFRNVSLIFLDRDADLKEPATTSSGSVDGMIISHVLGRGAPELVRFWGEPPLVRAPDVALFGIAMLDQLEQEFLMRSPMRRYLAEDIARKGAAVAAEEALEQVHGRIHEFVLHVNLNVIAPEDFAAANPERSGGLSFDDVRDALAVFARQPTLAALVISNYNPTLDPKGSASKQIVDLLVRVLSPRLQTEDAAQATGAGEPPATAEDAAGIPAGNASDATSTALDSSDQQHEQTPHETPVGNIPPDSAATETASIENSPAADAVHENPTIESTQPSTLTSTDLNSPNQSAARTTADENSAPDSVSPDTSVDRETPNA
jgi:arginase